MLRGAYLNSINLFTRSRHLHTTTIDTALLHASVFAGLGTASNHFNSNPTAKQQLISPFMEDRFHTISRTVLHHCLLRTVWHHCVLGTVLDLRPGAELSRNHHSTVLYSRCCSCHGQLGKGGRSSSRSGNALARGSSLMLRVPDPRARDLAEREAEELALQQLGVRLGHHILVAGALLRLHLQQCTRAV